MLGQLARMAHSMLAVQSLAIVDILVEMDGKYLSPFASCVQDHNMVRLLHLMLHIWNDFDHKKLIQPIPDESECAMIDWCHTNAVATVLVYR